MRIALVGLLWLLGLAALALLFPSLKEGYDVEQLPRFAGLTAGLIALAFGAWKALRAKPALLAAALLGLLPALAAYAFLTLDILGDEWRGRRLASGLRIESFRETPIEWPGFDGPVGLRLEIQLAHGVSMPGNLYPPKLRMAGDSVPTQREYFSGDAFGGSGSAFLQAPVFQNLGKPGAQPELRESPARLAFDLYPWKVQRYEAGRKVCFGKWDAERVLASAPGDHVAACWMFAGRSGTYVDMSALLTAELRRTSRYQGRREEWESLLHRLEPENLPARGFERCDDEQTGDRCYCRPG